MAGKAKLPPTTKELAQTIKEAADLVLKLTTQLDAMVKLILESDPTGMMERLAKHIEFVAKLERDSQQLKKMADYFSTTPVKKKPRQPKKTEPEQPPEPELICPPHDFDDDDICKICGASKHAIEPEPPPDPEPNHGNNGNE